MSSVVSRRFVSSPARDAHATWTAIAELLAPHGGERRKELLSVAGTAASVIADAAPEATPIIVTCDGPRTRIYCLYDEDAIDGADTNEAALGFDALKGNWAVSLPCLPDDLDWVSASLKAKSSRITARDIATGIALEENAQESSRDALVFSKAGFLGS